MQEFLANRLVSEFCTIGKQMKPNMAIFGASNQNSPIRFFCYYAVILQLSMQNEMVSSQSLPKVLSAIADAKSLLIFQSIAPGFVESDVLLEKTNLSRKQDLFENLRNSRCRPGDEKE